MQITREAALTVVLLSCIAVGVAASLEDGLPRPDHFADAPTTAYGPYPELPDEVDCDWYGFANELYPASKGLECLDEMRVALTNATENPASSLQPYLYYTLRRMIDPANNQSYCYQGCFDLGLSGAPASSPAYAPAPYVQGPGTSPPIYPPAPPPVALPPVVADAPYYSPEGSPALAPAPESGL